VKFLRWTCSSLTGHLVLVGVPFFISEMIVLTGLNYYDGTLTAEWTVHIAFVCAILGAVVATLVWHTITLPMIRRKGLDKERKT
jgi:hypothetical protein